MRDMTDRFRISREKLAYICDSTSASVITLVPISSWAVYLGGLAITATSLEGREAALSLFIRAVPFNLYCILTVIMVLLIVLKVLPDFGPMRTAEDRTNSTGKVLRDGAVPMMGRELTELEATTSPRSNMVLNFLLPVTIIVVVNITTFIVTGSANVLGSFLLACAVLGAVMWLQRIDSVRGLAQTAMAGIKGVMPAVVILALAYCINHLSQELGTARYVVSVTESWMAPALVPTVAFVISAFISFATGTSWGTYGASVSSHGGICHQCVHQFCDRHILGNVRHHGADSASTCSSVQWGRNEHAHRRHVCGGCRRRSIWRPLLAVVRHDRAVVAG
jgi:Na+/H+ antiporter NhaC